MERVWQGGVVGSTGCRVNGAECMRGGSWGYAVEQGLELRKR